MKITHQALAVMYRRGFSTTFAIAVSFGLALFSLGPAAGQEAADPKEAIAVAVDLASDVATVDEARRAEVLEALSAELEQAERESREALLGLDIEPNLSCRGLVAAPKVTTTAYLAAMRASYACFLGAQQRADYAATSEHLTAVGMYAELARENLLRAIDLNEATLARLENEPFAKRRSPEAAAVFLDSLKRGGLPRKHSEFLRAGGLDDAAIDRYRTELAAKPAEEIGISIVEFYRNILEFRRGTAQALIELMDGGAAALAIPRTATFLVINPRDERATVSLTLRRISIPSDWTLAIEEAVTEPRTSRLTKVSEGYEVDLGPKEQLRVASVVVPVGRVERDTTARWAVEGRIGRELLGGVVHDLYLPAVLPELTLPQVGSTAAAANVGASTDSAADGALVDRAPSGITIAAAVAAVVAAGLVVLLLLRRRQGGAR